MRDAFGGSVGTHSDGCLFPADTTVVRLVSHLFRRPITGANLCLFTWCVQLGKRSGGVYKDPTKTPGKSLTLRLVENKRRLLNVLEVFRNGRLLRVSKPSLLKCCMHDACVAILPDPTFVFLHLRVPLVTNLFFLPRMETCRRPGRAPAALKRPTTATTSATSPSTCLRTAASSRSTSVRFGWEPSRAPPCLRRMSSLATGTFYNCGAPPTSSALIVRDRTSFEVE